jgi:hypothetical protein
MSRWFLNLVGALCVGSLAGCNSFSLFIDVGPRQGQAAWWTAPRMEAGQPAVSAAVNRSNDNAAGRGVPTVEIIEPVVHAPPVKPELLPLPLSLREAVAQGPKPTAPLDLDVAHLEVKAAKPATDAPLVAALRCFLDRRPAEAVDLLQRYDKLSRDLLLCMFPLAARLAESGAPRIDGQEATALVAELDRLKVALEPRANLVIDKMCFTQRIHSFGVYLPCKEDQLFRPGDWVEVYVELRNFSNEKIADGYAVRLSSNLVVRDFNDVYQWGGDLQERPTDLTKTPRQDCFYRCAFEIDRRCKPGMYKLFLTIKDVPTGRIASRSLDFQVGPARGRGDF